MEAWLADAEAPFRAVALALAELPEGDLSGTKPVDEGDDGAGEESGCGEAGGEGGEAEDWTEPSASWNAPESGCGLDAGSGKGAGPIKRLAASMASVMKPVSPGRNEFRQGLLQSPGQV